MRLTFFFSFCALKIVGISVIFCRNIFVLKTCRKDDHILKIHYLLNKVVVVLLILYWEWSKNQVVTMCLLNYVWLKLKLWWKSHNFSVSTWWFKTCPISFKRFCRYRFVINLVFTIKSLKTGSRNHFGLKKIRTLTS